MNNFISTNSVSIVPLAHGDIHIIFSVLQGFIDFTRT